MSTVEHNDKHSRSKRYANLICSETDRVETCCRYPLTVDFVEFGWDWVIAPTGYGANYCSGECRYRHVDSNPQAYLMQHVPEDSGPCCTPSKFYPLAMLYFDHAHNVLYTFMQKMIVDRCGCAWKDRKGGSGRKETQSVWWYGNFSFSFCDTQLLCVHISVIHCNTPRFDGTVWTQSVCMLPYCNVQYFICLKILYSLMALHCVDLCTAFIG